MNGKAIKNKYDFAVIFGAGNFGGFDDGDDRLASMKNGGLSIRIDDAGYGVIGRTDIVDMVREYVRQVMGGIKGYDIYAEEIHRSKMEKAYGLMERKHSDPKTRQKTPLDRQLQKWLCRHFFDVRAFGADLTVGENPGGSLAETVQFGSARSVAPAPCPLYKLEGMVSAILAEKTGFSDSDLELLWQALKNIFSIDNSKIAIRKLIMFKHKSALGNAEPHELCNRVCATRKDVGGYDIKIDKIGLPMTVEVIEKDF